MNKAQRRFFHLPKSPPPHSINSTTTKSCNAIINRLSSENAHHDVLRTYSDMLSTNSPPDAYTYPSLLKACTSLNLLSNGLSFHQQVIINGYSSDPYIASSLINFYAKFGCTHHAHNLFEMMPERNVVPWSTIIGCYSRAGDVNMAFSMYNSMRHEGIQPSSVTMLGMLSGVSEGIHVQCLHGCSERYGFGSDLTLVNSMLNVYGKCGRLGDARNLFDLMGRRDIVSWNSLVSAYALIGDIREILKLLHGMRVEGLEPDQQTFGSLVSVTARESNPKMGKLVHGKILTAGFELDTPVLTSLVDKALSVFRRMMILRVVPSTASISSVLAACAQLGSFNMGISIHGYLLRQRIPVDIPTQNSLVTMYAKCGHLEQSCAVFDMMDQRDLVSWNAIIAGHAQNGHLGEALFLFNEMRNTLQRPDSITVVSLLQACASIGALHQGKWIHNFVIRSCLGPCILINTALVDMYSKCGDLNYSRKCFESMSQHDLVSWSTIIAGYGSHGKGEIALEMYSKFLQTGLEPNHVIFLAVLCACSHNGLVDQGMSLFHSITNDYEIEPTREHCACIVDLLCRAGRVEDAYNFCMRMFPEPMVDVLGILLDACRVKGKTELGNIIAKEISMLKPVDAGNYVQLAHSCASQARWEGVGEAWVQMRSLGLKKLPGWSFIELHGTITTFFMGHRSHSQYEDIVLVLKSLSKEIRRVGMNFQPGNFTLDFEESENERWLLQGA
ncbi:unnamed protein product [Ilex paraguariensis]|uniref:Chlororespiratory reduction 4 n=1 Tax=Ilex paraguariensis TaxID=185542 RepID=A0ABC8R872_9AQUA